MPRTWRWFALSAAVVLADQLVKWGILNHFAAGERREVTEFFNLVLVFNKGAAFSFLAQAPGWQTPLLTVFALAAAAVVSVFILRNPQKKLLCLGLALILGGALGNVIDRLRFGHVVDFVDLHLLAVVIRTKGAVDIRKVLPRPRLEHGHPKRCQRFLAGLNIRRQKVLDFLAVLDLRAASIDNLCIARHAQSVYVARPGFRVIDGIDSLACGVIGGVFLRAPHSVAARTNLG